MCGPKWFGCSSKCFWDDPDEAWRTLYDILYRTARRRGVPDQDAQDLVSETVCAHWRFFPALPEESDPVAYAVGILQRRVAGWYKKRYEEPPMKDVESLETSVFHLMGRHLAYHEEEERTMLLQAFQVARASLPERDRQVIDLHWEGLTHAEIATRLGESEDAIKSRFSRAFKRIKEEVLRNIR